MSSSRDLQRRATVALLSPTGAMDLANTPVPMRAEEAEQSAKAPLRWDDKLIEERETAAIQRAANELANAKANYERLLAHRQDRINRLHAAKRSHLLDMG